MTWQTVKLGDILKRKKNLVEIKDDEEYKLVTVRLFHKGVNLRKVAKGNELSSNKMHSVKTGEFILSGIDARHGAFGIVPAELEGAVVSNDFWCLSFDESIIEKHFFLKLTSTTFFDDLCKKASDGTTNRVRLQADKFFNLEITLPPIEEQKDFVRRYSKFEETNHSISTELNHQLALVKELRQAYLREAMQGKLARQDASDEPAEILLEKIKAEKEKLVAEKRIRRGKPLPPINAEEIPFEIPSNWTWCRLGEIITMIYGSGLTKSQTIPNAEFPVFGSNGIVGYFDKFLTDKRAIVIGRKRSSGALNVSEKPSWTTDVAYYVEETENINFNFLHFLLSSLNLDKLGKGIKPGLNRNEAYNLPIPLPPLAEQERIVAKLEKLMKFCDELEVSIRQGIANADQLLQTALKEALHPKENF